MVTFTAGPDRGRHEVDVEDYCKAEALVEACIQAFGEEVIPNASTGTSIACLINALARLLWRNLPVEGEARARCVECLHLLADMVSQPATTALTPAMDALRGRQT